ncbi:tachykinin-like peptides receptor 99D [Crassostrea angulata]|uniref:tachykinin-like peptides receptor 99D n=1 Tax=Magallana angulata TaxID=2784310 RepID=UPI0022B0D171|nr:tachykinin-like peptides receptor 99D [Crassostrea angulata]
MDINCVNNNDTSFDMFVNNISNLTANQMENMESPFQVPVGVMSLLAVLYGLISILAVFGNLLVIIVILKNKNMQSITNIFIANLALGDVLIGIFSIPFQFQAALLQRWVVPYFLCPVAPFIKNLTVCVSVFTLTIIAIDRYIAVMRPLKAGIKMKVATFVLVSTWLFGIISSLPNLFFFEVIDIPDIQFKNQTMPFCAHAYPSKMFMSVHVFYLSLMQYFLPLLVINFTYFRIVIKIWGTKAPGQQLEGQETTRIRNRKKVVKMLIIVVCLFVICWLPLHVYQVLSQIHPAINSSENIHIIWFCSNWLAMSNSCYNPFVYGLLNSKFKREYRKLLSCVKCSRKLFRDRDSGDYSDLSAGSMQRAQMCGTQISSIKNGSFQHENNERLMSLKKISSSTSQF